MPVDRLTLASTIAARDENESYTFAYDSYKDAGAANCAFQVVRDAFNRKSRVYMTTMERYGQSTSSTAGTDGTAIKIWTGQSNAIVQAFNSPNSTIYENTTSRGAITGLGIWISETVISGVATCVIVSASNRAYSLAAGVLAEITNGNFPPKQGTPLTITGNFVHAEGYAFIACTNGQIWHSDLNSIANWSASSFLSANEFPDALVGLAKLGRYIVALGLQSIQFFYVAGNPGGSVLTRAQLPTIQQGVINQYCIAQYKDVVAIVGQGAYGNGVFLVTTDGIKKISTFPIDQLIEVNHTYLRLHVIGQWGSPKLLLTYMDGPNAPSATRGFLYDDETGIWIRFTLTISLVNTDTTALPGTALFTTVGIGYNNNGRYYLNSYSSTDETLARVKLGPWDARKPGVRKVIHSAKLIGQSRIARTVAISYSDDDGLTWSTERTGTLDDAGASTLRPQWYRLGSTYSRMWHVSLTPQAGESAGDLARLEALMIDYEECEQ